MTKPLAGKVAVVTGSSRGIGRGIALELGAAGATVYVTGRARDGGAERPQWAQSDDQAGTIDGAAREITELGGVGIAAACDHRDDAQVAKLFEDIRRDQGRLDILVNNVCWNDLDQMLGKKFWELEPEHWDKTNTVGLRSHFVASKYAAPLLMETGGGLIVNVSSHGALHEEYIISVPYCTVKAGIDRLSSSMHHDIHEHGVSVISIWPGLVATEKILANGVQREDGHIEVFGLDIGVAETPRLSGRSVVALATDANVAARSGKAFKTPVLAQEYGFTDVNGMIPDSFSAASGDEELPEFWKDVQGG